MSVAPIPTFTSVISQYDLAFQVSPILLVGGVVSQRQGGITPIVTYTGLMPPTLAQAFARYVPLAGSTLISQSVGMYPFANQAVAANATIQQPLTLSMKMIAPVNQPGGYLQKLSTWIGLQQTLQQHNAIGGTYIVATPAFIYYNLLLISMTDIGESEDDKQQQIYWQLDFIQPIVTVQGAKAVQSTLMQKLTNGGAFPVGETPAWSGNLAASPASPVGVTGALGDALATFGV